MPAPPPGPWDAEHIHFFTSTVAAVEAEVAIDRDIAKLFKTMP